MFVCDFIINMHLIFMIAELSELEIVIRLEVGSTHDLETNPDFFFSKVTGYLAFKRLKNLDVTVECPDFPQGLSTIPLVLGRNLGHDC